MKKMKLLLSLASVLIVASMILGACAQKPAEEKGLAVGIVLPTNDETRWIQDASRFKAALTEQGYAVEILFSQGSSAKEKVAKIPMSKVREIAELKMPDLNANDVDAACKIIAGTARRRGIEVVD